MPETADFGGTGNRGSIFPLSPGWAMTAEELAAIREVVREELAALVAAQAAPQERLLDVDAAAEHLGLSTSTTYKIAQRCELSSVKLGGRLLFKVADLDAYTEARRRSPERVREMASRKA